MCHRRYWATGSFPSRAHEPLFYTPSLVVYFLARHKNQASFCRRPTPRSFLSRISTPQYSFISPK